MKTIIKISSLLFLAFYLYSCSGTSEPQNNNPPVESQPVKKPVELRPIDKIIGIWKCDSSIMLTKDLSKMTGQAKIHQSDLATNSVLKGDIIVKYYQSEYKKSTDVVIYDEFRPDQTHINTEINKFSIKEPGGKRETTSVYEIMNDTKFNESDNISNIIREVSDSKLVYEKQSNFGTMTFYLTKVNTK